MEKTAGPAAGLRGRTAESHICQKRADMGHPAVVAGLERKKRYRQIASIVMTRNGTGILSRALSHPYGTRLMSDGINCGKGKHFRVICHLLPHYA